MLDHAADTDGRARPDLSDLIERLSRDGKRWAAAELAMARIEISGLKRQVARALGFAVLGFAAVLCALVALSQAGIAFLTPVFESAGVAALLVAASLMALAVVSYLGIRAALQWEAESIFFRCFTRTARDARRP